MSYFLIPPLHNNYKCRSTSILKVMMNQLQISQRSVSLTLKQLFNYRLNNRLMIIVTPGTMLKNILTRMNLSILLFQVVKTL